MFRNARVSDKNAAGSRCKTGGWPSEKIPYQNKSKQAYSQLELWVDINKSDIEELYRQTIGYKEKVYNIHIPRNIKVAEATSKGKPVVYYDKNSTASKAYLELALEIINNNKKRR